MSRTALLVLTVLVVAILIAYLPALKGGFIWDDDFYVTGPALRSLHGLWRIWFEVASTRQYYPLLYSAFWLEHRLWGDAAFAYHLVNVLLHGLAVSLLLLVLRRLAIPGAVLAAALFALHPVYVESVAWIAEQKNTLSTVFYLSAIFVYLRFDEERNRPSYALASVLFLSAVFTKTVTASLPAALLVVFWWRRGRLSWQRDVVPLIPWFVSGAAVGTLTAWVERALIGANGAPFELTFLERFLLAGRVVWFYAWKLFWPADLMFIYPRWTVDPSIWWHYLFLVGAFVVVLAAWLMRRKARAPLAAMLFFIGSLFPVLGFLNVFPFIFSFVADHFQYLSSLGIIVAVSAAISLSLARLPREARWAGHAVCVVVLVVLMALTWSQSQMYRDAKTLYETTIAKNPGCWMCRNNLGILLDEAGRYQNAIEHFQAALLDKPDAAFAHTNLGNVFFQTRQFDLATEHYEQALKLKPNSIRTHLNLGNALLEERRFSESIGHFEQAIKLAPNSAVPRFWLGNAFLRMQRLREAKEQFESVLRIDPNHAQASQYLFALRARMHDVESKE